jgi:hypothetical protein
MFTVTIRFERCPKRITDMYSMYPCMHVYVCQTKSKHSQRRKTKQSEGETKREIAPHQTPPSDPVAFETVEEKLEREQI